MEVSLSALTQIRDQKTDGWDRVYYVINLGSFDEVNKFVSETTEDIQRRCFLVELNDWEAWGSDSVAASVEAIHELGLKAFGATRDSYFSATTADHLRIFRQGIDVAYTYNLENAVEARKLVNTQNKVFPA